MEVQPMRLLFTGVISPWLIALLFLAASVFSVVLYKRHELPKPWSFWLPATRIAVIFLLLLSLLQPVVARIRTVKVRGSIPVLVDTSGSMSVVDMYSTARQIDIAWHMGLFARKLRSTAFSGQNEEWVLLKERLAEAETAAGRIRARAESEVFWSKELEEDLSEFLVSLENLADRTKLLTRSVVNSAEESGYLGTSLVKPGDLGKLAWRRYDGIGGSELALLKSSAKYPDMPEFEGFLTSFHAPLAKDLDNYGAVASGCLIPPVSGEYEFFLTSDDEAELLLSTDNHPENKRRIAHVPTWTMPDEWDKHPSQKSGKIRLEARKGYYVEALLKEGVGGDHLTVGWVRPDGRDERPIPGNCLALEAGSPGDERFNSAYQAFLAELTSLLATVDKMQESVRETTKQQDTNAQAIIDRLDRFQDCAVAYRSFIAGLAGLQELADERLVSAGIDEVNSALDRLSGMTRSDLVRFVLTEEPCRLIERLSRRGEVAVFSFEENVEAVQPGDHAGLVGKLPVTKLGSTMYNVLKHYEKRPVAAMIVLSDGNNNAGKPVVTVKRAMRERDIPVFAVGVGSDVAPPDIAVARVTAPRTSFLDDILNVSVILQRQGAVDRNISVKVLRNGIVRKEQTVEPGEETTVVVDMSFVEKESGMAQYEVQAEMFEGEAFEANNVEKFSVNILEDRIRALLIDEFPRWESRYANMMLRRDRRVDLKTVFIGSTRSGGLPTGPDGYPRSREGLFAFDILIVGDVNPAHFSEKQMRDIHDFVVERGGSLVAMAGEHYMPYWYSGTRLEGILPLRRFGMGISFSVGTEDLTAESPAEAAGPSDVFTAGHAGSTDRSCRLQVSDDMRYDDLLQIGSTPETSQELWENLPAMNWVSEGVYVSHAADVLVEGVHGQDVGRPEAVPVVVKTYAGLGKVLYLGSDSFWRWRYRARWTYHHRLWGQILLWATTGRTAGSDRYVKLMTDRSLYAPEETITIKARILDDSRVPISDADASVEVFNTESELVRTIPLTHIEKSGGEYRVQVRDLPKGKYRVSPRVQELADRDIFAEVEFEVRDLPTSEYIELALDETQLRGLSENYVPVERIVDIVKEVPRIEIKEEHRDDVEIWNTWLFMLIVTGLLGFEWQMRKKHKLA
jgi:hypothetical protein